MLVPASVVGKLGTSLSVGLLAAFATLETEKVVTVDSSVARWGAVGAIAVTSGLVCQIILQIMARMDAAKAAKKVEEVAAQQKADAASVAKKVQDVADKQALDAASASKATDKVERKADVAAVKVEEVKATLKETDARTNDKLDDLASVAKATHTLVNSNMGVQLKLNAAVTRRLANLTKNTPDGKDDKAAADLAERMFQEHEVKQQTVDDQHRSEGKTP